MFIFASGYDSRRHPGPAAHPNASLICFDTTEDEACRRTTKSYNHNIN